MQLRDGGEPLWTGVLDGIPTTYEDSGRHRARVTAFGIWSTLRDATVSVGSLEATTTAQGVIEILEDVDVCGFPVGSGFFTMDRWWELGRVQEAIHDMEDTEGGYAYERKVGDIGFQSGGWRASRTLAATFSGLPVLVSGEHAIIGRPNREIAIKDVVNEVVGFVREFATETGQIVFQREEAVAIGLGTSVLLVSDFEEDGAVLSIDTPVAGTDYTIRRNADGTGADDAHRITVTTSISQFNEMQVELLYPTQGGTEPNEVFLTMADLKGTVLRRLPPDKVVRRAATSITPVQAQDAGAARDVDQQPAGDEDAGGRATGAARRLRDTGGVRLDSGGLRRLHCAGDLGPHSPQTAVLHQRRVHREPGAVHTAERQAARLHHPGHGCIQYVDATSTSSDDPSAR